ncbi:MAG: hypothetical protein ACLUOI_39120 [Eisenbergiella sp.]
MALICVLCGKIGGERQLYLMDLASGDAVQLTEGEGWTITAD